ncbi:hypothetical protein K9O30_21255 [Clostridium bowmanii]|uniref:hypothetical protein n=1 Tax=Clostridium bowmanii TaxID=132925 RepID=UPI001C0AB43A|nr:hypothetical protein [Clostridium bowmanii]MBU3191900.1 hypothetical protein [Clostridium bowmanii]MCA1076203.1 hypothetical protein [Clostridium bowmanii]
MSNILIKNGNDVIDNFQYPQFKSYNRRRKLAIYHLKDDNRHGIKMFCDCCTPNVEITIQKIDVKRQIITN